MTSDVKLPIAVYDAESVQPECDWCYAAEVREQLEREFDASAAKSELMIQLRDRVCKAEAERDKLRQANAEIAEQISRVVESRAQAEAQRDRLVDHLREIERRFWIYQPRGTDECLANLAVAVHDASETLADIDKETT